MSVIIWLAVLIYWIGGFFYRLEGLQVLRPGLRPPCWCCCRCCCPRSSRWRTPICRRSALHLVIALLAYSLFTIASLQALMMALLERRLHGGPLPAFLQSLPPLLTMERLLFRIIAAGFVLLTLTLASGMLFSEELFGQPLQFTHKVVFGDRSPGSSSPRCWRARSIYGWRGRVALRWTLAGFLALVLAYIGSKFVLEVLLQR